MCVSLSEFAEVFAAALPDFSVEAVPPAEGPQRGFYRWNQLVQPHFNGHQLSAGGCPPRDAHAQPPAVPARASAALATARSLHVASGSVGMPSDVRDQAPFRLILLLCRSCAAHFVAGTPPRREGLPGSVGQVCCSALKEGTPLPSGSLHSFMEVILSGAQL